MDFYKIKRHQITLFFVNLCKKVYLPALFKKKRKFYPYYYFSDRDSDSDPNTFSLYEMEKPEFCFDENAP